MTACAPARSRSRSRSRSPSPSRSRLPAASAHRCHEQPRPQSHQKLLIDYSACQHREILLTSPNSTPLLPTRRTTARAPKNRRPRPRAEQVTKVRWFPMIRCATITITHAT
jgi:hypothetical protein